MNSEEKSALIETIAQALAKVLNPPNSIPITSQPKVENGSVNHKSIIEDYAKALPTVDKSSLRTARNEAAFDGFRGCIKVHVKDRLFFVPQKWVFYRKDEEPNVIQEALEVSDVNHREITFRYRDPDVFEAIYKLLSGSTLLDLIGQVDWNLLKDDICAYGFTSLLKPVVETNEVDLSILKPETGMSPSRIDKLERPHIFQVGPSGTTIVLDYGHARIVPTKVTIYFTDGPASELPYNALDAITVDTDLKSPHNEESGLGCPLYTYQPVSILGAVHMTIPPACIGPSRYLTIRFSSKPDAKWTLLHYTHIEVKGMYVLSL